VRQISAEGPPQGGEPPAPWSSAQSLPLRVRVSRSS
jgi:hypothetical protein